MEPLLRVRRSPMTMSLSKAARLAKLGQLSAEQRIALYGDALEAWKQSLEQLEIAAGATPTQARLNVALNHEASLRQGYPTLVKAQRDAFMDRHVGAAIAS